MGVKDFSVRSLWQQHVILGLVMSLLVCFKQVQAQTTKAGAVPFSATCTSLYTGAQTAC